MGWERKHDERMVPEVTVPIKEWGVRREAHRGEISIIPLGLETNGGQAARFYIGGTIYRLWIDGYGRSLKSEFTYFKWQ